jgi:hypothetical protein
LHFLFKVEEIFVPVEYRGAIQNYVGDIAIIVSKEVFKFSQTVQPVCVDWGKTYLDDFLKPETEGLGHVGFMLLILKSVIFYKSALL